MIIVAILMLSDTKPSALERWGGCHWHMHVAEPVRAVSFGFYFQHIIPLGGTLRAEGFPCLRCPRVMPFFSVNGVGCCEAWGWAAPEWPHQGAMQGCFYSHALVLKPVRSPAHVLQVCEPSTVWPPVFSLWKAFIHNLRVYMILIFTIFLGNKI